MKERGNISERMLRTWTSASIVMLTGIIIGLFYWLYEPFRSTKWGIPNERIWLYVMVIIAIGMFIITLSRIIMRHYGKKNNVGYINFGVWIFSEVLVMAAAYSLIPVFVRGGYTWDRLPTDFGIAMKFTPLILFIPYSMSILCIIIKDQHLQIKSLQEKELSQGNPTLSFIDEKGEHRLSIKKDNLLYIESADNYACIWYLQNAAVKKFFLRNTLKYLETMFTGTNILRCHRSYIVNFDHVATITRTHDGVCVEIDNEEIEKIPVSKSYAESVTKFFIKD